MPTFNHLQSVISENLIAQLRQRAEDVLMEIYHDYFSNKSFEHFKLSHLAYNQSLVMQIATYRFAAAEIIIKLRDLVYSQIHTLCENEELLIHPTCFLRFNFPETCFSKKHEEALLATEPHYDRTHIQGFNLCAFTCWVALDHVDQESGGICLFTGKEIADYFTNIDGLNHYDYKAYLETAKEVDPLLRNGMITPVMRVGDVLVFDSNVLHGATKPLSRRRISFDFRIIPSSDLKEAPLFVRQCFEEINSAYDIFMANQLIHLGDFLGASRILRKVSKSTDNRDLLRVALAISKKRPDEAILKEISWK